MTGRGRPYPLRRALAAGAFALLSLGGLVGFITGARADEPQLAVPAVHDGDRGAYVASIEYRDGTPAGRRAGHWEALRFQWLPAALVRDGDGVLRSATRVETYLDVTPGLGWTSSWAITATDATTGEVLHDTLRWSDQGGSSLLKEATYSWTQGNYTEFAAEPALCGLRAGLQGAPADADHSEPVWLEGGCSPEAGQGSGGRTWFHREGTDLVDGRVAGRFAPVDGGPLRVWFTSGIAAPVQVLQPAVADDDVRATMVRLRLVGWQQGTTPMVPLPSPPSTKASPLEIGSRDDLVGPDATGVQHPFPLAEGIAVARADPRTGLEDFLANHPDAYVMAAYNFNGVSLTGPYSTWNLYLTDGTEAVGAYATKNTLGADALRLELPAYEAGPLGFQSTPAWLPDPDQVPAALPTVLSVLQRWEVLRGQPVPAIPAYGFGFWCQDSGCDGVLAEVFAGSSASTFSVNNTGASGEGFRDILSVNPAGEPQYLYRMDSQSAAQVDVVGFRPLPPLAPGPVGSDSFEAPEGVSPSWSLPAGRAAAGTVLAAILVAIATYAWPAVKHGGIALFSRLSQEEISSHPTRQAILDVVTAQPGIHFQALCRTLVKGRGVVGHHLAKLLESGQVTGHRKGGFTCYFTKGQDVRGLGAVTALKAEGARRLLRELGTSPDRSGLELADSTGLSPSTVHYHLRKLQDAGLVAATIRGRSLAMRLTTEGERAASQALESVA